MRAIPRTLQFILRAASQHLLAVLDEELQHPLQAQHARLAVHQRQHLHAKGLLQRRQLEEVGQDILGLHIARQFDHHAHARAVALVAQVGDALDLAIAHQRGNALQQRTPCSSGRAAP